MEISEAYIMGIKEGRETLSSNPDFTLSEMKDCFEQCKRLARDFSQPMKDVFKGECDFWKNQIKLKQAK